MAPVGRELNESEAAAEDDLWVTNFSIDTWPRSTEATDWSATVEVEVAVKVEVEVSQSVRLATTGACTLAGTLPHCKSTIISCCYCSI